MTEFKIGDIVRLTKGEPDTPGYEVRVREVTTSGAGVGEIDPDTLRAFEDVGWTVELIERPLPTKPNTLGWATYQGETGLVRRRGSDCGDWDVYSGNGFRDIARGDALSDFTEAVLIPKELADRVTAWLYDDSQETLASLIVEIADHLKGQDDE